MMLFRQWMWFGALPYSCSTIHCGSSVAKRNRNRLISSCHVAAMNTALCPLHRFLFPRAFIAVSAKPYSSIFSIKYDSFLTTEFVRLPPFHFHRSCEYSLSKYVIIIFVENESASDGQSRGRVDDCGSAPCRRCCWTGGRHAAQGQPHRARPWCVYSLTLVFRNDVNGSLVAYAETYSTSNFFERFCSCEYNRGLCDTADLLINF